MTVVLENYRDDPVGFVEEVLGQPPPYEKQREILRTVAVKRRVSVVGANGSGKDWAAARAVLWWLSTRPRAIALVTGPTSARWSDRGGSSAPRTSVPGPPRRPPLGSRGTADDRFAIGSHHTTNPGLSPLRRSPPVVRRTTRHAGIPRTRRRLMAPCLPRAPLSSSRHWVSRLTPLRFFATPGPALHLAACIFTFSVYDTPLTGDTARPRHGPPRGQRGARSRVGEDSRLQG